MSVSFSTLSDWNGGFDKKMNPLIVPENRGKAGKVTIEIVKMVIDKAKLMKSEGIGVIPLLAHEAQHVYDSKKLTSGPYALAYLFPQILGALSLLALLAIWFSSLWLLALLSLLFFAPIPAPGRMWIERRGYLMSLVGIHWAYSASAASSAIGNVLANFDSGNYYYMWPFREKLHRWFVDSISVIADNPEIGGPVFESVHRFIKTQRGE